jgi:hypothetical protein
MSDYERDPYSWYSGQPAADIISKPRTDYRKLPNAYPQMGGPRDLATTCSLPTEKHYLECLWGDHSSGGNRCMYRRPCNMCDKLTDKDGKGIN